MREASGSALELPGGPFRTVASPPAQSPVGPLGEAGGDATELQGQGKLPLVKQASLRQDGTESSVSFRTNVSNPSAEGD